MKTIHDKADNQPQLLRMLAVLVGAVLLLAGFTLPAGAAGVSTTLTKPSDIEPGTYSLVAYGCHSASDPATMAFLRREDSPYNVEVAGLGPNQIVSGLAPDNAYRMAKDFVTCNPDVKETQLSRVTDPNGNLLGYELKPLYIPLRSGSSPGVATDYSVHGNNILARIIVDPLLKLNEQGGSG